MADVSAAEDFGYGEVAIPWHDLRVNQPRHFDQVCLAITYL